METRMDGLKRWWNHPCRFGHEWLYVRGIWHPFHGALGATSWRGCRRCHKDEYAEQSIQPLDYYFVPVPNLRIQEHWKSVMHPSGWTENWYQPPKMSEAEWGERGGYVDAYPDFVPRG